MNITYKLSQDVNPDNVKTTHRNHLTDYCPIKNRRSPLITNYAVISRNSDFYKNLVNSQDEQYNSGREKQSLEVMFFVITPIQNKSVNNKKMILNFNLEQTQEYFRMLVQCNNHLEVKNRAPMKIEHCFPYLNYNHILCPWLLCLDNRPSHQTNTRFSDTQLKYLNRFH